MRPKFVLALVAALTLALASPAMAHRERRHHDHHSYRSHSYHHGYYRPYYRPVYRGHYRYYRPYGGYYYSSRPRISIGFGYGAPVYYGPRYYAGGYPYGYCW